MVSITWDVRLCGLSVRDLYSLYDSPIPSIWLNSLPIRVMLPGIPIREGETDAFKKKVRKSLMLFLSSHKILTPLRVPVILQAIYKPPEVPENFYKDLDNIMRLILPIFNDIFKPPPSHLSVFNSAEIEDEYIKRRIEALPKSMPYSVVGYEIMGIPRRRNDDPSGYITMGITANVNTYGSLWNKVDEIIRKWSECLDKR